MTSWVSGSGGDSRAEAFGQGGGDAKQLVQMCRDGWVSAAALADADVRQSLTARLSAEELSSLKALISNVNAGAANADLLARLQQTISLSSVTSR